MRKIVYLFLAALFLFPVDVVSAAEIREGDTLTLEQCLAIAMERHPDLRGAKARIEAKDSSVGQAEAGLKPELDLSSTYKRHSVNEGGDGYDGYSNGFSASQLISDWGETKNQVAVAKKERSASKYDYDDTVRQLAYDVKDAYFGLLKAMKEKDVAREAVKMYEHHLEQAKAYYKVGKVAKYDVTTAEVDLSNGNLDLIKAGTSVNTAKSTLDNVIGYPDAPDFGIKDMLSYEKTDFVEDEVLKTAFAVRPDLKNLEATKEASEMSVAVAAKSNSPSLYANAGYSWGENGSFSGNEDLYLGLSLSISLYDGDLTKEKVREAKAVLEESDADVEALKHDITLEVKQAFLEVRDSEQAVAAAEETVRQAKENLDLANGRYEVGVGSPVEVTDATENYIDARNTYYGTLYDYRMALAALEEAVGGKMK